MKLEKLQKITEKHKQLVLEIRKNIRADSERQKLNFNYPRYPKGQAYVERMNRTLQEELMMYYEDYKLEDIHEFNKKMLQYMLL